MFKKIGIGLAVLGAISFGVYLRFIRPWQLRWGPLMKRWGVLWLAMTS